jgi:hypothetical protein
MLDNSLYCDFLRLKFLSLKNSDVWGYISDFW